MTDAAGQALVEHGVDGQGEPQTSPQKRKAANVRGQVESVLTTSVLPAASAAKDTAFDPVKEGRVCWIDNVPMPPVPELTTASERVNDFVRRATLGGVPASRLLADMSSLLESDMVPILCHLIKHGKADLHWAANEKLIIGDSMRSSDEQSFGQEIDSTREPFVAKGHRSRRDQCWLVPKDPRVFRLHGRIQRQA